MDIVFPYLWASAMGPPAVQGNQGSGGGRPLITGVGFKSQA